MRLSTPHRTPIARHVRRVIPVACLAVGFALLTGCFTVPATQQFQTNGKLRPETLFGKNDKIAPGKTRMEEALVALRQKTSGATYQTYEFGPPGGSDDKSFDWVFSDNGRQVGVDYQVRTGTEVWPLCFASGPTFEWRQFVLDLDENGFVTGYHLVGPKETAKGEGVLRLTPSEDPEAVLNVFTTEQRARLHAAGLIPNDATLEAQADAIRASRNRPPRRPATAPSTTKPLQLET